jgi:hypothetical protein
VTRVVSAFRWVSVACRISAGARGGLLSVLLVAGCAADEAPNSILFGPDEDRLPPEDLAAIHSYVASMFPLADDGSRFEDTVCGDVDPAVEITDLNDDGVREVFVHWGNACTSGMTGRSLSLLVKNEAGEYREQFGFPAFGYTRVTTGEHGFPDLELGGPGFCAPVWSWNGGAYEFKCNLSHAENACADRGNLCPAR